MIITPIFRKDKTKYYINSLLNQINDRKIYLSNIHSSKKILTSIGHKIANDQELSFLYIKAEKELERLYTISYTINGVIQVSKNL